MPRIRSIKPEFWADEAVSRLPRDARLLFVGLWNFADDSGRLRGSVALVRAQVFPYDSDVDVDALLQILADGGFIQRYEADQQSFLWIKNFNKHQKIDKPSKSQLPEPPRMVAERSPKPPRSLAVGREGKGEERNGGEGSAAAPPEPVLNAVQQEPNANAGDPWPADVVEQVRVAFGRQIETCDKEFAAFLADMAQRHPLTKRVNAVRAYLERPKNGKASHPLGYLATMIAEGAEPRNSKPAVESTPKWKQQGAASAEEYERWRAEARDAG